MYTTVTLSLHENYVETKIKFYKQTARSYVEYSLCGANVVDLLREQINVETLQTNVETFIEDWRDVTENYLDGFKGHFTFTYHILDGNDIQSFEVISSRFINPSHGGRSVNGAFRDKTFGKRIFTNLLEAASKREVNRLNNIMTGLYNVGG